MDTIQVLEKWSTYCNYSIMVGFVQSRVSLVGETDKIAVNIITDSGKYNDSSDEVIFKTHESRYMNNRSAEAAKTKFSSTASHHWYSYMNLSQTDHRHKMIR